MSLTASPLHLRILGEIEGRIVSGEWPPGHRVPFETDLARQYGCSRMTVNKVMTRLAGAGLVVRRRKVGSVVAAPPAQSAIVAIRDVRDEVEATGLAYTYERLSLQVRRATGADRARLQATRAGRVLDVACLHRAAGAPFCHESRLIDLDTVPEAVEQDFATEAPGPWLLGRIPWTAAEHRIGAVAADRDLASHLGLRLGGACLVVERQTANASGPVTAVTFTYPAGRHVVTAEFRPGTAALAPPPARTDA